MSPSLSLAPTFRALFVGTLGALAIGVGVPYGNMVLSGSRFASYYNTPAAIILFFFLVLFLNSVLGLIRRTWMLNRAELALVYVMWIVATAIPEKGLVSFLLPDITSVIYYATPENRWDETLLPVIPDWIIPHHDFVRIQHFYEGAPAGRGVPWMLWLPPLAYWISFVLALYLAMISIMVILRKRWIENERLAFPLAQLAIAVIQEDDGGKSLIRPFFKSWIMWLGFAVPAVLQSINGLHHYFAVIPRVDIGTVIGLFRNSVHLELYLSFQLLGFSYFIKPGVAIALCVFGLVNVIQRGLLLMLGFGGMDPVLGAFSSYSSPLIVHQGFGAMLVLVLFGLWTARGHLRQVFRKAFKGDESVDDSAEILSYRAAVFLLLGSLTLMGVWLWKSGLPGWIVPIYLFLVFVVFIGLTRIVSEGGLVYVFAPMIASDFVAANFGTRALGASGIISLAFTYTWASDILTFVMASCANGLKVVEETIQKGRRLIFWSMLIAIVVSLFSSIYTVLDLAYRYGGVNTDWGHFVKHANYPFDNAAGRIESLVGPNWTNWGYTASGVIIMTLLMTAQQRFAWWPLHPLGFPISGVSTYILFSVFLAWLIKTVVLKYGGPPLYVKTRPFFLGLILGQFVSAAVWYVIDYLTGTRGNHVMFV